MSLKSSSKTHSEISTLLMISINSIKNFTRKKQIKRSCWSPNSEPENLKFLPLTNTLTTKTLNQRRKIRQRILVNRDRKRNSAKKAIRERK